MTPSKIRTVINFYAKALKRFLESVFAYIVDLALIGQIISSRNFENEWNKKVNLKIILIGENSFLRLYCNMYIYIVMYLYGCNLHTCCSFTMASLTISWRRPLSYRNQSNDLLRISMDWFLYGSGLRHERVNRKY